MQPGKGAERQIRQKLREHPPLRYERLSDPILVKRAKDGDERALAALCERHAPRVERLCAHLLRNPEDARDAAQEALAKLCCRLSQFRGESRFSTWLHRLVVNTCRDVADRERYRAWEPLPEDRSLAANADPARHAALRELREDLRRTLGTIAPTQARVLVLKDGLDYSFAEISALAGIPEGTAKCYAHRARAALRAQLRDREVA